MDSIIHMEHFEDIEKDSAWRLAGICLSVLAIVEAVIGLAFEADSIWGLPIMLLFYAPLPVLSFMVLTVSIKNRSLQIHVTLAVVFYMLLLIPFFYVAPIEAAKDAQGALIYIFGPLYLQIFSLILLVPFSLIYFIVRHFRKKKLPDSIEPGSGDGEVDKGEG